MKLYKVLGRRDGNLILKPIASTIEPDAADFAAMASTFTSSSLTLLQPEQVKREANQVEEGFGTSKSTSKEYAPELPNLNEKESLKQRKL